MLATMSSSEAHLNQWDPPSAHPVHRGDRLLACSRQSETHLRLYLLPSRQIQTIAAYNAPVDQALHNLNTPLLIMTQQM
jgi:hypothetical protein